MEEVARTPLAAWESFYVIVGSSGAALTGLQFVVIALIPTSQLVGSTREIEAFGTPTIVHFCSVLLLSAILSAPWHSLSNAALALGACSIAGISYSLVIIRRARRQTGYRPVFEDWLFFAVLPLLAHALLFIAALLLASFPRRTLFLIAAISLLLLFIGIHNAWDSVTYIAVGHRQLENEDKAREEVEG